MKSIILKQRSDDVKAEVEGEPGRWGAGKTPLHAVGDLVTHHSEFFGIKIEGCGISVKGQEEKPNNDSKE